MKGLIVIFALYLITLNILPCVDAGQHACVSPLQTASGHNHQDDDKSDACSPFCVCSCCNIIVMVSGFNFDGKPEKIDSVTIFPQYQDFNPTYFSNVWQPPKII
jgi:hypothetical protein